jgi:CarboxypepD_reg-like domain
MQERVNDRYWPTNRIFEQNSIITFYPAKEIRTRHMKKIYILLVFFLLAGVYSAKAQFETFRDSVVQLYGVVMTADSLKAIPSVSVVVKGQNRGTITNDQGVFSIVVMKGDKIEFTSIGYKPKLSTIPLDLKENQYSVIQLLVNDTVNLAAFIIKPKPTSAQFARDFVTAPVPDDDIEVARKNTEEAKRRVLLRSLPADGREAANSYLSKNASRYYSAGQAPPIGVLNPFAWKEFIQAWKRGDYKKKK